jgi:hypothetical protein
MAIDVVAGAPQMRQQPDPTRVPARTSTTQPT